MRLLFFLLVFLLIWLQYQLWLGKGSENEIRQLQQAIEKQKEENALLAERNAALQAEVKDLKEGVQAIEEFARSEMGMIKEDEVFYQIVEPTPETDSTVKK